MTTNMCERPGRNKTELPVALPRPRTVDLLTKPGFMKLKRLCLDWVQSDAKPSAQRVVAATQSIFKFAAADTGAMPACAARE